MKKHQVLSSEKEEKSTPVSYDEFVLTSGCNVSKSESTLMS